MPELRVAVAIVPGPTNMLQIKRFVASACVFLHLVSTGCASASYAGGGSGKYGYASADTAANMPMGPMGKEEAAKTRSFESVSEQVTVAGTTASENEYWSGGEADESYKKDEPPREAAPPAPPPPAQPAPVFRGPDVGSPANPARQTDGTPKIDPASTTPAATGKKGENSGTESTSPTHAPMLIYTGNVQMAVYEVRSSLNEVETLARSIGGFLSKRDDRSITIRVPAARFDDTLRRIEKMGDMIARNVEVEDVTEEFNDVDIRLKNARAVRDRLEQLLAKASKVEESIQIEKELERVALVIERLEGRMKFLKDRAAYSTITVTFQPRSAVELGKRPFNLPVPWIYEMGLGRLLAL